jgi:hypothetical protein
MSGPHPPDEPNPRRIMNKYVIVDCGASLILPNHHKIVMSSTGNSPQEAVENLDPNIVVDTIDPVSGEEKSWWMSGYIENPCRKFSGVIVIQTN